MLNPSICLETLVSAPIDEVWTAWTTREGIKSFFAPDAHVDLRVDGPYEIFFMPDHPAGCRGADGMRILSFQAPRMLAFTWNAPPHLPEPRAQHTHVIVRLEEAGGGTKVGLWHDGWGLGGQWDEAVRYFERAWKIVLDRLQERFTRGPVNWSKIE